MPISFLSAQLDLMILPPKVFIPAEGMAEFQHNLGELIDEYDNGKIILRYCPN